MFGPTHVPTGGGEGAGGAGVGGVGGAEGQLQTDTLPGYPLLYLPPISAGLIVAKVH